MKIVMLSLTTYDGRDLTVDYPDVSAIEEISGGVHAQSRVVLKNGRDYEVRETSAEIRKAILRAHEAQGLAEKTIAP